MTIWKKLLWGVFNELLFVCVKVVQHVLIPKTCKEQASSKTGMKISIKCNFHQTHFYSTFYFFI